MLGTRTTTTSRRSAPARHLAHIDGLRGLMALWVMLHHAWLQYWPAQTDPHPIGWLRAVQWLAFGHYAVPVFIVISGFCLGLPVVRRGELVGGALHFYRRRIRRIIPPYYAATALSAILGLTIISQRTGTHWDNCIPVTWSGLFADLFLYSDLGGGTVNHVFWSVAVECRIYLLFPLIVVCWQRLSAAAALLLAVVAAYLPVLVMKALPYGVLGTPHFLLLFVLGFYAAQVVTRRQERGLGVRSAERVAAFVLAAVTAGLIWRMGTRGTSLTDLLIGGLGAVLMIISSLEIGGWVHRVLAWRPLPALGLFAYSIYLIHAPLLQLAWYAIRPLHAAPPVAFALMLLAGCPAVLGVAYLFFLLCERPFLRAPLGDTAVVAVRPPAGG